MNNSSSLLPLVWIIPLILWEMIWKGIALWKSGRHNQPVWFVVIFILNTFGIVPIVYLAFFQKKEKASTPPPTSPADIN